MKLFIFILVFIIVISFFRGVFFTLVIIFLAEQRMRQVLLDSMQDNNLVDELTSNPP